MPRAFNPHFWEIVKWVRLTTIVPFRLKICPGLKADGRPVWGLTSQGPTKLWTIHLNSQQPGTLAIYTLLEEVAHIQDFVRHGYVEGEVRQHRDSWARRYGWWIRAYYTYFNT